VAEIFNSTRTTSDAPCRSWKTRDYLTELGVDRASLLTRRQAWQHVRATYGQFYIYVLWRTDRQHPIPFYVGKGRKGRFALHTRKGCYHQNPIRSRIIELHKRLGISVLYTFPLTTTAEDRAHFLEQTLIRAIGRRNLKLGPLSNLTDGGEIVASGLVRKKGCESPLARPVWVDGVRYGTVREATERCSWNVHTIYKRARNGFPGCFFEDEGQRPRQDQRKRGGQHYLARRVQIDGIIYPSIRSAADQLGLSYKMIMQRFIRGVTPGYYYVDQLYIGNESSTESRTSSI